MIERVYLIERDGIKVVIGALKQRPKESKTAATGLGALRCLSSGKERGVNRKHKEEVGDIETVVDVLKQTAEDAQKDGGHTLSVVGSARKRKPYAPQKGGREIGGKSLSAYRGCI